MSVWVVLSGARYSIVVVAIRFFDALQGQRLGKALKAVRRLRGMTAADVARAMGMPMRSYEHFESGAAKFDFDKVRRFAEATDSDPAGILFGVLMDSPRFAANSASSKAATVFLICLEQFDRDMGDRLAQIDAASLMAELDGAFSRLSEANLRSHAILGDTGDET